MGTSDLIRRLYWAGEALVFAAVMVVTARMTTPEEWTPVLLVILLAALTFVGDRLSAAMVRGQLTTAHIALVLAMTLLGPGPAVVIGVTVALITTAQRSLAPRLWLNNLMTYAVFAFTGAVAARELYGSPQAHHGSAGLAFGLIVFGVFLFTIVLNFLLFSAELRIEDGRPLIRQLREDFVPLLPGLLAAACLAALLAVAYANLGIAVLVAAFLVLLIFHYLTNALLRSEERADQLEARSIHLANLQFGILSMLMDALALRDRSTSRHAAATARLAKALAIEAGCDEEQQEVVHTAALLHDIGKFAWPDRLLHPQALNDEDWSMIRRHPQDGAALVGKLDGYGPVADAILYHHERVDGTGYPAQLIGAEIPLASRIIAVCSTYDTMTMTDALGPPMSPEDAKQELGRLGGTQLDEELIRLFLAMLERQMPGELAETDYDSELAFEQHVRRMAEPTRS